MDNLDDWLSLLENRHKEEIQLGLERVARVAETMDLLNPGAVLIHLAGTNGKGSTVAMLESIYHAASYSVAAYTSPHLLTFNERIRFNKQAITDKDLVTAFKQVEKARGETHLTYFEMTTLAALSYFKECRPDVIILETGLGGRLDATNILDTDLAIITTIDLDHQAWLGNTREEIAREKAGILRHNQTVVYADTNPPQAILERADALNCSLFINARDYELRSELHENTQRMVFHDGQHTISLPESSFHAHAISAAVKACFCLQDKLPVSPAQIQEGVAAAHITGRTQIIEGEVLTVVDVAHNPQSAEYLAAWLKRHHSGRKVHAVFSALADKDIAGIVAPLLPHVDIWYPAMLQARRAASSADLLNALNIHELDVSLCYNDPVLAYQAACKTARTGDLVLVYGSFLTVAAVLESINFRSDDLSNQELL
ncbi:bifunctional tetrahydrofolate synthase/dihydrofolate synthase [Legionella sp. CNM-4043-24]|uniref:bifunctional tetrahydrofolate synthase/dihydrofolate synthase n=1 Tax=Legionella sp. CNM-4043-24 TaxID=3421646 RepID=UPI00403A7EF5